MSLPIPATGGGIGRVGYTGSKILQDKDSQALILRGWQFNKRFETWKQIITPYVEVQFLLVLLKLSKFSRCLWKENSESLGLMARFRMNLSMAFQYHVDQNPWLQLFKLSALRGYGLSSGRSLWISCTHGVILTQLLVLIPTDLFGNSSPYTTICLSSSSTACFLIDPFCPSVLK